MNTLYIGDVLEVLKTLPDESVNCCVTSPPYYCLRDYGVEGQIGLEKTPEEYIEKLVNVFREVRRVLKNDGTLWLNIGDTYNGAKKGNTEVVKNKAVAETSNFKKTLWEGCKNKDLIGIPWMLAFALRADGWYLRQDIIWHKPNPMPESVTDRCTKSHEYLFLLSKEPRYYFDNESIKENAKSIDDRRFMKGRMEYNGKGAVMSGKNFVVIKEKRNKRDVWSVPTRSHKDAHFAIMPEMLVAPCIVAGCPKGGTVLEPFCGSGTTLKVCKEWGRNGIGIELNPEYEAIIARRIGEYERGKVK